MEQGTSSPTTVSNGAPLGASWMPAWVNDDCRAATSSSTPWLPVEYWREKDSLAPEATPAPHWSAAGPGRVHTSVPLGTIRHPWARSRAVAAPGSYGYGLRRSALDTNGLAGTSGTGPYVALP